MANAQWSCPHCEYSATPNEILSVRSHFDAHSLECVRCLYRTETKATWKEAEAAYRLSAKPADEMRAEAYHECAEIATFYNDCGGNFIAEKIRDAASQSDERRLRTSLLFGFCFGERKMKNDH